MLGGVTVVDRRELERESKAPKRFKTSKKKSKKKEKRKKEKSKHRSASPASSFDTSASNSDEEEHGGHKGDGLPGVSHTEQQPVSGAAREEWMTKPMEGSFLDTSMEGHKKEQQKGDTASKREDPDTQKVHARELNPDMRPAATPSSASRSSSIPVIGDGGASWKLKALQRAQAAAATGSTDVRAEVESRWGSIAELTTGLQGQRAAHANAHLHAARDRARKEERRSSYLEDVKSDRGHMKRADKTTVGGSLGRTSWRRDERGSRDNKEEDDRHRGSRHSRSAGGRSLHDRRTADSLEGAAKAINAFANDGSFMATAAKKESAGGVSRGDIENTAGSTEGKMMRDGSADDNKEKTRPKEDAGATLSDQRHAADHVPLVRAQEPQASLEEQQQEEAGASKSDKFASSGNMNLGAAAALRARLLGKKPAAVRENATTMPDSRTQLKEEEFLPMVDARGRAVPGAFGREGVTERQPAGQSSRKAATERYGGGPDTGVVGERQRYFADDDDPRADVAALAKRAKHGDDGTADLDRNFARGIMKSGARFRGVNADDEYDHDVGAELLERGQRQGGKRRRAAQEESTAARDRARQLREFRSHENAQACCPRCFTGSDRPRHLTLAIGQSVYLALPPRGRLVPGHCQILPMDHVASARRLDEAAWTEVRNFKKCLIQMNMQQGMDCIFVETAMHLNNPRTHTVIDCVPVPMELSSKAPMVFRKAIDDATSEWSQHHAKRFIDTSTKGLRGCIPDNFPYMNVDFGIGSGFVHVIDDEAEFDPGLGRSVLAGLLRLPETEMHRRAKAESQSVQQRWAQEFRAEFDAFDWTKMLD